MDYLIGAAANSGDVTFEAGPVRMCPGAYWDYASASQEESPLYLFDPQFADHVPVLGSDFTVPGTQ